MLQARLSTFASFASCFRSNQLLHCTLLQRPNALSPRLARLHACALRTNRRDSADIHRERQTAMNRPAGLEGLPVNGYMHNAVNGESSVLVGDSQNQDSDPFGVDANYYAQYQSQAGPSNYESSQSQPFQATQEYSQTQPATQPVASGPSASRKFCLLDHSRAAGRDIVSFCASTESLQWSQCRNIASTDLSHPLPAPACWAALLPNCPDNPRCVRIQVEVSAFLSTSMTQTSANIHSLAHRAGSQRPYIV